MNSEIIQTNLGRAGYHPILWLKTEVLVWITALISHVPGHVGILMRRAFHVALGSRIGKGFRLLPGARVARGNIVIGDRFGMMERSVILVNQESKVVIGDDVSVNTNAIIDATPGGTIEIGDNVLIGPNVVIRASNHSIYDRKRPIHHQGHDNGKIVIGEGTWICANAVITANVVIGKHAVIGAGTVVSEDVPPFAIVGCSPPTLLAQR